ncbi:MAG: ABC transporter ATP-binding protein [Bacteroidales bacterium]
MSRREDIILELHDLGIGYYRKGRPDFVFRHITSAARKGEMIALMGRNGMGKSTLLKCVVRMLWPLEGQVELEGKPLTRYSGMQLARKMAWVSTEPVGVQHLRVYDLVSLGRYPWTGWMGARTDADRRAVWRALESVGITTLADRDLYELSDGERQRAMIARALAQDADLIVLDEPTAFLDLVNRYEIIHLLLDLSRREGKCIIFSSHDWHIATGEADLIWLMDEEGWISGSPEDLALANRFERLVDSDTMDYNPRTGLVKLVREPVMNVAVEGEGDTAFWTRRALERIGCTLNTHDPEIVITVVSRQKRVAWQVRGKTDTRQFPSLYELVHYILRNRQRN